MRLREGDLVRVKRSGDLGKVVHVQEHRLTEGRTTKTYDIQFNDEIERYTQNLADKTLIIPRSKEDEE